MYVSDATFGVKFLALMASIIILFSLFEIFMRKWLHVEKKNLFSYNHVNGLHKKIDWTIRISFTVLMIIFIFVINSTPYGSPLIFSYLVFILFFANEGVRAYMEWKYLKHKNDYILTICRLILWIIVLGVVILGITNFGWFD